MKIQFLGANRQVTGSRYLLEFADQRILVDCGLFQEREFVGRNWDPSPIEPSSVRSLILTHAHIDHCGQVPRFVNQGYRGAIVCTRPTAALCEIMLEDAAKIQMEDAEYKKRRHQREGRKGPHPEAPLYTDKDAAKAIRLLDGHAYEEPITVSDGVTAVFHDAGHILGSAIVEMVVDQKDRQQTIVFSGDIGQWDKPIIRDPTLLARADVVIMESTYGDQDHPGTGDLESELAEVIVRTAERGGNLVIPTFALERAQELIYHLGRLRRSGRIPEIAVFLDSPMAVDVTYVFRKFHECFDDEAWEMISSGDSPLRFPGLRFTPTGAQSRAINEHHGPCVIMSASGMCTAGRIKHHLRSNLGRAESTVLFVGYQANGTLGRTILDGAKQVRIHGKNWQVRCEIAQIFGLSAHAGRSDLLRWVDSFEAPRPRVFLTHGEEDASLSLHARLRELGWKAEVPHYLDVVEL